MRLYAKLALFVVSFVILARASGEAGREWAWEAWFAARCQAAHLLGDQQFEERLVAEAGVELRRRLESHIRAFLAQQGTPAAPEFSKPSAHASFADGATQPAPATRCPCRRDRL